MKKLLILATAVIIGIGGTAFDVDAATKKKPKHSAEQLKKIRQNAMDACRKRFGQGIVVRATFDTRTNRYICYTM